MDTDASATILPADEETKGAETKGRGFAGMSAEKQRELARLGGKAAHARGTAHEFSGDEARVAGRKGGLAVAKDREYMSKIGREGARRSAVVRRKTEGGASRPTIEGARARPVIAPINRST